MSSQNRSRLRPEARRELILRAAVEVAREHGYLRMTREQIADRAGVSTGLVTWYCGAMDQLRKTVMQHAVADGDLTIIGQGLAGGDPIAKRADTKLKRAAIEVV